MTPKQVLITGGDGYLGLNLARRYLESTEDRVLLWLRASNEDEFRSKKEKVGHLLAAFNFRVSYRAGNLADDRPFDSIDPRDIRVIIHAAAVTRFNVDETTARKVNIEGTQKVLHFANQCPSLEAFGLLSTVYASGLKSGLIEEVPLDDKQGFSNHYERSKWESETALLTGSDHLPWRIFRVATIIAHDNKGYVVQQNAFHNTLKLFYYGLLSLIPGRPETPVYLVSGEFVSHAIFTLMHHSSNKVIYHVSHTKEESLSLGELIDVAFETFEQSKDFKMRRVLKPLYSDLESFDLLADGVSHFGGGIVHQAVSSVAPFAQQLFIHKEIRNHNLVSALGFYQAPESRQLVRNTCEHLVQTKWRRLEPHDSR